MKRLAQYVRYSIAFLLYPFFRPPWYKGESDQLQTLDGYRAEADAAIHALRAEFTGAWRHREPHRDG